MTAKHRDIGCREKTRFRRASAACHTSPGEECMHHARTNPVVTVLNAMNDCLQTARPKHQIIFRTQRSCEGAERNPRILLPVSKHTRRTGPDDILLLGIEKPNDRLVG